MDRLWTCPLHNALCSIQATCPVILLLLLDVQGKADIDSDGFLEAHDSVPQALVLSISAPYIILVLTGSRQR